ncbi:MAG TPA: HEPN domain-containing protein, partial [bacterium]|nr:HEPN domain-containing protein [bacterium]
DLAAAQTLLRENPQVTDVICFHTQQCVEKALKGYLTYVGRHVEKTHHLPLLLGYCVEHDPELMCLETIVKRLTPYAVEVRYPDDWREISVEEASAALQFAEEALKQIEGKIVWSST